MIITLIDDNNRHFLELVCYMPGIVLRALHVLFINFCHDSMRSVVLLYPLSLSFFFLGKGSEV